MVLLPRRCLGGIMASSQGKEECMETTEEKRERFRAELEKMNNTDGDTISIKVSRRGPKRRWPFYKMEIGDEVTIWQGKYGNTNPQARAFQYGAKYGKKFRTQKVAQDTYRIVRIA